MRKQILLGQKRNAVLTLLVLGLSTIAVSSLPRSGHSTSSLMAFVSLTSSPTTLVPGEILSFNSTLHGAPVVGVYGPVYKLLVSLNGTFVTDSFVRLPFTSNNVTVSIVQSFNTTGLASGTYLVSGLLTACPRNLACIPGPGGDQYTNSITEGSLTVVSPTISFNRTLTFGDVTLSANAGFAVDQASGNVVGFISVQAVNNTSGAVIFSNTANISTSLIFNTFRFVLGVPSSPFTLGYGCVVAASSGSANCMLSRDPDIDHSGRVDIVDIATIAIDFGSVAGSPSFNAAADLDGDGRIGIVDLALDAVYYGAPVF